MHTWIIIISLSGIALLLAATGQIRRLNRRICKMSEALDRLTTEVSENTSAIDSAITLITTLAEEIRNNVDNSVALNALADELDAKSQALAAAVQANTDEPTS